MGVKQVIVDTGCLIGQTVALGMAERFAYRFMGVITVKSACPETQTSGK